jgi:hypothetical protein
MTLWIRQLPRCRKQFYFRVSSRAELIGRTNRPSRPSRLNGSSDEALVPRSAGSPVRGVHHPPPDAPWAGNGEREESKLSFVDKIRNRSKLIPVLPSAWKNAFTFGQRIYFSLPYLVICSPTYSYFHFFCYQDL